MCIVHSMGIHNGSIAVMLWCLVPQLLTAMHCMLMKIFGIIQPLSDLGRGERVKP